MKNRKEEHWMKRKVSAYLTAKMELRRRVRIGKRILKIVELDLDIC